MEHEFGGTPYDPEAQLPSSPYVRCTPSAKVHLWETPTLVIHGAKDFRLVESEGIATFTALQRRGVPSEMLYLPAENHRARRMLERESVAARAVRRLPLSSDGATASTLVRQTVSIRRTPSCGMRRSCGGSSRGRRSDGQETLYVLHYCGDGTDGCA